MRPVRFIRAWQTYSVGAVIHPTAAFGQTLVNSNICEYIEPEKETVKKPRRKKKARRK